jgi:hypothetical protein
MYGEGPDWSPHCFRRYLRASIRELELPEANPQPDILQWSLVQGRESAKHARDTANYEDYIALVYSARTANAVLASALGEPYRVRVTLDGAYLTERNKGADILCGEDGKSFLLVNEPRMYSIVESPPTCSTRSFSSAPTPAPLPCLPSPSESTGMGRKASRLLKSGIFRLLPSILMSEDGNLLQSRKPQ